MTVSERGEREVLLEQLDELIGAGAVDASDALEIAICAGLAQRLGADPVAMSSVNSWRASLGQDLLDEVVDMVDPEPLVDAIDGLLGADDEERVVEETVFDFDDLVAVMVWIGKPDKVSAACRSVSETIRMAPDVFTGLAPYGKQMSQLPTVGLDIFLYDYWLALADAG